MWRPWSRRWTATVPCDFFVYCGSAKADGNSMYCCLKCPTGSLGNKISCHDESRQNLKKHIQVCHLHFHDLHLVTVIHLNNQKWLCVIHVGRGHTWPRYTCSPLSFSLMISPLFPRCHSGEAGGLRGELGRGYCPSLPWYAKVLEYYPKNLFLFLKSTLF